MPDFPPTTGGAEGKRPAVSISVIIPVFNAEFWLERSLASVRAQTFPDLEIIVVDDGSTDAGPDICARHAGEDARVRLLRQGNLGPSGARNAGLDAAAGRHIMFVDADDFVEPDMMETLFRGVSAGGCRWALSACRQWPPPGSGAEPLTIRLGLDGVRPAREALMGFARRDVKAMTLFASSWNKIYHAGIIRRHGIRFGAACPGTSIPVYPQEDFFFNLAYMEHVGDTLFIDRPLYNYQHHAGNLNAVRKYRPHAFELHREVYGAIRRTIWDACSVEERRNFNRHYIDKTLIIMAMLCRDNPIFGRRELLAAIRDILADPGVRAALAGCAGAGSQDNRRLELMRDGAVRALYRLSRRQGNQLYGPA